MVEGVDKVLGFEGQHGVGKCIWRVKCIYMEIEI